MVMPKSNNILKILIIFISLLSSSVMAFSASPITVTNTNDHGPGSLRWAINYANSNGGAEIEFNIQGSGPYTIQPQTPLPDIAESVVINGYSQPGAAPASNTDPAVLLIELDGNFSGNECTGYSGLSIYADNCIVRGIVINRFGDVAIDIYSAKNIIEGNYIGTDVTGTIDLGNCDDGVRIWDYYNKIGGTTPAARNIISGNGDNGVEINGPDAKHNLVQGNYIGIDASGKKALGNYNNGILIVGKASYNMITINFISGNGSTSGTAGIWLQEAEKNSIVENFIGTNAFEKRRLANNSGIVLFDYSDNNDIMENIVIGSNQNGFWIKDSSDNTFTENTAKKNGQYGFSDETTDGGTLGTANTYLENMCEKNKWGGSAPERLCSPQL